MAEKETTRKHYPELSPFGEATKLEAEILAFWEANRIFERSVEERPASSPFVFYEGPPTANGRPGVHHALSRTIKDLVCRYQTMKGHRVVRKAGWDTHGLPVEIEVEHQLGLDGKDQIEHYGVAAFNEQCRKSVFKYLDEWLEFTKKLGFWLDLDDPYITFKNEYIESVWWILKQFWDQDMLFQGHKIVPYCPRCGTSLSSHEVSQGYADVQDPSIYIKLKLVDEDAYFLVWTTTPWTLISNVALAVGPDHDYVRVRNKGEVLILAEALVGVLDGDTEILGTVKGSELIGKRYEPCFPFFDKMVDAFRVIGADFVSLEDGTGIVHMAPAFGEDDYNAGKAENLPMIQPVDEAGKFTAEVTPWAGHVHQGRRSRDHHRSQEARPPLPEREDHALVPVLLALQIAAHLLRAPLVVHQDDGVQGSAPRGELEGAVVPARGRGEPLHRVARGERRLGALARALLGHAAQHLDVRVVQGAVLHRLRRGAPLDRRGVSRGVRSPQAVHRRSRRRLPRVRRQE